MKVSSAEIRSEAEEVVSNLPSYAAGGQDLQGIGEAPALEHHVPQHADGRDYPECKSAFRIRRVATRGSYTVLSETARPS
jgi:hypothetical protein